MDSLTHIALGASLGEALAGRRIGRWAPAWGAAIGTLPDVDVVIGQLLPTLERLVLHRGPTHSLLFVVVAALVLGWLINRIHRRDIAFAGGVSFAAVILLAAVGLDCFTAYGTSLFWPFSDYSVSFATIAVIDPLFTLPLIVAALVWLWLPRANRWRRRLAVLSLSVSTLYLASTVVNKYYVNSVFREALDAQGIQAERLLVKPTIFNTLLWRAVAEGPRGYWIGFYSHLDDDQRIEFRFFPHHQSLLTPVADREAIRELIDLMQGWYRVELLENGWQLNDMRYGQAFEWLDDDRPFVFSYRLVPTADGELQVEEVTLAATRDRDRDRATLQALFDRIAGARESGL